MSEIRYRDTRGLDPSEPTFTDVVIKGIAHGGGLYVPQELPRLPLEKILELERQPYNERAAYVFGLFGVDIDGARIADLMSLAYGEDFDHPAIAPVETVAADMHVLELWHGPTSAFKDMALQCMPLIFSEAVDMRRARGDEVTDYLVLVATSGDTGKAALEGFADRPHTRIAVFYPADGVSEMQRLQMVTQHGSNVAVFGVKGNFDDCQNAVKAAFNDPGFGSLLDSRGIRLSSANSINWGRLLPQIVYYVSAYADMVASGGVKAGDTIDVCVPTGNFGNVLGAYYAREIGVPIERLLCASNENNVLSDFISTGVYDISERAFVKTPSPSMDILISSNLERLLFEITEDGDKVRMWLERLANEGIFQVDKDTFQRIRAIFSADWVTNNESYSTIRRVFQETGYLLDPHTAVAWEVAERLRSDRPVLVVSADVYAALNGVSYGDPLPADAQGLSGVGLLRSVSESAGGAHIPEGLATLDDLDVRFEDVVESDADSVMKTVLDWIA